MPIVRATKAMGMTMTTTTDHTKHYAKPRITTIHVTGGDPDLRSEIANILRDHTEVKFAGFGVTDGAAGSTSAHRALICHLLSSPEETPEPGTLPLIPAMAPHMLAQGVIDHLFRERLI